ncbi:MAG: TrmB family transcriptional regulator [Candidatus Nanoarchaeia archaeon]
MIVSDELLGKLRRTFDLNLYEVRVWTALLSRGVSTAGELSDIANVPRSRSYDVLESLEKRGFVVMKLGKPIKYIAVSPSEVVDRVKKNMRTLAEQKIKRLDDLKETDVMGELNSLHTQGIELVDPTEISGSLRGRQNLYNHLESMIKGAQKTVTLSTTAQGLQRKFDILRPLFEKLNKRGVKVRVAVPSNADTKRLAKDLSGLAEVRASNNSSRFCVVDGKQVTFMVTDDKDVHHNYDSAVWVHTPYFAEAMDKLFDKAWQSMKPLK